MPHAAGVSAAPFPTPERDAATGPPDAGLSAAAVAERVARGLVNRERSRERSDREVIRENALTFFNVVLATLIVALLAVGAVRDGLVVGGVVAANVAIATLQELRAIHRLRALVALTAPSARVVRDGVELTVPAAAVVQDDLLRLLPGDQVVADGPLLARSVELDESLLTGESEPVRRHPGDLLRSGSFCTAGDGYYRAQQVGAAAYAFSLAAEARQLVDRSTPLQLRLNRIIRVLLTLTGVLAGLLLIQYNVADRGLTESLRATTATIVTVVPAGLLLSLTVTFTIGALRVSRAGAIVQETSAVEALNYIDIVCLDKTGTLTTNRLALADLVWVAGADAEPALGGWLAAFLASSAGESRTATALADALGSPRNGARAVAGVPFASARRWSALVLERGGERRCFVLGAPETLLAAGEAPALRAAYAAAAERGLRGVVFAEAAAEALPDPDAPLPPLRPLALLTLGDELRREVRGTFALMAELGITAKVISGDNPHTVVALLRQLEIETPGGAIAGDALAALEPAAFAAAVETHSVFGRIAPAQKAAIVTALRERGHFVAMVGDGANDVQALRAADAAVAMASGTATARAVAGIVLLHDSFEALIRGAREATFVLGNSARLSKLFLAKSVYAYLLIVATNMLGLDFPFRPTQGSITSLLTLGIPAIFIALSVPPPHAGRNFTHNVLRWALPASIALAASAIIVHLLMQGVFERPIAEARTLVSLTLGVTGVCFVVEVLGFEGASWRNVTRPLLTSLLGLSLLGCFVAAVYFAPLRRFFDFTVVSYGDWTIVGVAVVAALSGQFLLGRYWLRLLDFVVARPAPSEELRGRAV